jgi:hypothetical protein
LIRGPRNKGGGFFLFITTLLPLTLIGVALVADYSRAVLANRQVTNTADTVAMAAATAFNATDASGTIDPLEAASRAREMLEQAEKTGMIDPDYEATLVDGVRVSPDGATVSITVEFTVPEFFVIGAVMAFVGGGDTGTATGRVTRGASICLPDSPPTAAGCAYPLN